MTLRTYLRTTMCWMVVLLFCLLVAPAAQAESDSAPGAEGYQVKTVQSAATADGYTVRISGNKAPTYTMYELFEPLRIVLDIAEGGFANSLQLPVQLTAGPVSKIDGRRIDDKAPALARVELFMVQDHEYSVAREDNDIVVTFKQMANAAAEPAPMASPAMMQEDAAAMAPQVPVDPSMAGYNKKPITVDFYKIDLHNVFRLFGELSGYNIIIDQGVGGTLTLSLKNVPWDFVLDLIVNLKDLEVHEKHNTLVISTKGKQFAWPERKQAAEPNLQIKGDVEAAGETFKSLTIQKQQEESPEIIAAKKKLMQARAAEQAEDFTTALSLYEEAYSLWPANNMLAKRLASQFLVQNGMNAKAVHYGKAALKNDPKDHDAALYVAIGLANMKKTGAAKEFFDLAVSGEKPSQQALMSYAIFNEEQEKYVAALLLLAGYEELYGDTLDTMIARARMYDKQGSNDKAVAEYRAIKLSGFALPADLDRYINGRIALGEAKMN